MYEVIEHSKGEYEGTVYNNLILKIPSQRWYIKVKLTDPKCPDLEVGQKLDIDFTILGSKSYAPVVTASKVKLV